MPNAIMSQNEKKVQNGPIPKDKKNVRNLPVSMPENHYLTRETAKKIKT